MDAKIQSDQRAELVKVFSIADRDGNGSIDSSELGNVMKTLAGTTPSPQELHSLMEKMDSNKDGKITLDEFVNALSLWLKEEESVQRVNNSNSSGVTGSSASSANSLTSPRKRKADQTETRTKIHKRISSFFLQFHRSSDFENLREKYLQHINNSNNHNHSHSNNSNRDDDCNAHNGEMCDSHVKLQRLDLSKNILKILPELATRIRVNNDVNMCLDGITQIAEMLSIVEVFQTPEERYEIGEYLVELFKAITDSSVISRIIEYLSPGFPHVFQFQALRIVSYYGGGLRIAHTPSDSLLHPDKLFHKTIIIRGGGGHALVPLLTSPCQEVREQAVVAVGKLCAYDADVRDFFLQLGVYPMLYTQITTETNNELLEKLTFTISIFCGRTHQKNKQANYNIVSSALYKLCWLFFRDDIMDEKIMINVCISIRELLVGINLDDSLCLRLVYLLERCVWVRVQEITLSMIIYVVKWNKVCAEKLMSFGLLSALTKILENSNSSVIRIHAIELASCLLQEKQFVDAVVAAGVVAELVRLLNADEAVSRNVLKVFTLLVQPSLLSTLIQDLGIVKALSDRLTHFKQYDSVLRDTYQYLGAAYDFDLVHEVIEILMLLLKNIITNSNGSKVLKENLLKHFDLECVEKIRQVMMVCASKGAHEMDAWRASSGIRLENELQEIMEAIRVAHQTTSTSLSTHITTAVQQHLEEFKTEMSKNAADIEKQRTTKGREGKRGEGGEREHTKLQKKNKEDEDMESNIKINIKCVFHDDIRVLENVPRHNITLKSLQTLIAIKYGGTYMLQYPDKDGDLITIDSDGLLQQALTSMEHGISGLPSYKFQLKSVTPVFPPSPSTTASTATTAEQKTAASGSNVELAQLVKQTNFTAAQLSRLYGQFRKHAANNALNRTQFATSLKEAGVTDDPAKSEQFFVAFDYDHNGSIDFLEFASSLSVLLGGSMDERLELAFKAYDKDGNGRIDRTELTDLYRRSLGPILTEKGLDKTALNELVQSMVNKCFTSSDLDGDGTLSLEEFKEAAFRQQIVVESFWKNPI